MSGTGTTDGTVGTEEPVPEDLEGKIELAVKHMEEGRNGVARALLLKAQEAHAGDPKLDEVQYRIAETWFNEGDWRRAISDFNTVIETWPKGQWAPWAMLAQGDAAKADSAYELADVFCGQARLRVEALFDALWSNTDSSDRKLAARLVDGEYGWLEAGVLDQSEGTGPWIADWSSGATDKPNVHRAYL